jgi:hypothetical protein
METNFSEKYARRLTPEEIQRSPSKYFLPLFGVPKWPGGWIYVLCLMLPQNRTEDV